MKKYMTRLLALALVTLIGGFVHAQTFSVLYNFGGSVNDPIAFFSPGTLAQGPDGNIYTTSAGGGVFSPDYPRNGTVFRVSTTGEPSDLYTFTGLIGSGANPYGGLTLGTDGNFYGTTPSGGQGDGLNNSGLVFKIDPSGNLTNIYYFTGGNDGSEPFAAPIAGTDGNFYGTTNCGGIQACAPNGGSGGGTVYQMTPAGMLTPLHQFDCSIGCDSYAPLVQGTDGNFYGTTSSNFGSIFRITPSGTFKTLYRFDGIHGEFPGALIQASNGSFYGTTELGGANGYGVVFKMTPAGKLTVLHSFANNGVDGYEPVAGLVQATDGNLYGVTEGGGTFSHGTIFSINPTGAGYSNPPLYNFDGTTGLVPEVALLQHTNGLLYGLTEGGGAGGWGTFYSFDVVLKPSVKLVPTTGGVGATIDVFGQGFTGTKKVSFAGLAATFFVVTDTYLTATVPSGAKTGVVTVKTPGGTLKSNTKFRVLLQE